MGKAGYYLAQDEEQSLPAVSSAEAGTCFGHRADVIVRRCLYGAPIATYDSVGLACGTSKR